MGCKYAVVGSTGNVGREILQTLAEKGIPASEVTAIASANSLGVEVSYGDDEVLKVFSLEDYSFKDTDIVLSSPGSSVSAVYCGRAAEEGAVIIDNTSQFRMDPEVPLVIPEVNPETITEFRNKNIIANPNCSTIQMLVALKPLHDVAKIRRIVVSTYQSVSGAGKLAMDELFNQTRGVYANDPEHKYQEVFPKAIAFNVIPHIDMFMENGSTKEEWKMVVETQKILGSDIMVHATCVRVPVFIGHAESVNVEFGDPITADEAREILRNAPGVAVVDHHEDGGYVTPSECAGEDLVYVSRIRDDLSVDHGISLWIVADNLRKGAALNAVQIAEELVANHMRL